MSSICLNRCPLATSLLLSETHIVSHGGDTGGQSEWTGAHTPGHADLQLIRYR